MGRKASRSKSKGRKSKGRGQAGAVEARVAARLDALYAELPKLECKGLCAHSCLLPLQMAPGERDRIRRECGLQIPPPEQVHEVRTCPALKEGRCSVYEFRPMVCRLWGIDESMPCPHGCVPEGGWISRVEGYRLAVKRYLVGGWPDGVEPLTAKQVSDVLRSDDLEDWLVASAEGLADTMQQEARLGGAARIVRMRRSTPEE
jgi:hypothetical protein